MLGGPSDFKASNGWLDKFRFRHGVRELQFEGESLSRNLAAANKFKEEFSMLLNEYSLDSIYNVDESRLLWRSLPRKSLVSRKKQKAPGFKVSKDRVTIMVGANASGTHRLPLLLIGKSAKPRCFSNVKQLPVDYKNQKSAWMSGEIFIDWYKTKFIPSVKKFRENSKLNGSVLLLLDNAPTHPSIEI